MPLRHHHHHRHHSNYQASNGLTLMFLGAFIGSPLIFWFGFFQYASAPTMAIAAATATGSALLSFATGALILYASIGLTYFCSAAHECYKTDKGLLDVLKSRFSNEGGLSAKGIINTIGAVLWSPFLVLGSLSGMAIKSGANAFNSRPSSSVRTVNCEDADAQSSDCSPAFAHQMQSTDARRSKSDSYTTFAEALGLTNSQPVKAPAHQRSSSAPIHSDFYAKTEPASDENMPEMPTLSSL
jgi:hypothetical protein